MRNIKFKLMTILSAGAMAFQMGGCSMTDLFGGILGS